MVIGKINYKRGQVTIFIILALILVVLIMMIFISRRLPELNIVDEENPQAYIESCTREALDEAIEIISVQGGELEPKGSLFYNGKNVTYLCYNANYYSPCIMQRPNLVENMENEITEYLIPRVNNCFNFLETRFSNYDISVGEMKLNTRLEPNNILVEIDREFTMKKGESVRTYNNFKVNTIYPLYDLAGVAMNIANQKGEYCSFNPLAYMLTYPRWDIKRIALPNSNEIYEIKEIKTNQGFVFAIRSCALPAGF